MWQFRRAHLQLVDCIHLVTEERRENATNWKLVKRPVWMPGRTEVVGRSQLNMLLHRLRRQYLDSLLSIEGMGVEVESLITNITQVHIRPGTKVGLLVEEVHRPWREGRHGKR
jgi:hypothetical protein